MATQRFFAFDTISLVVIAVFDSTDGVITAGTAYPGASFQLVPDGWDLPGPGAWVWSAPTLPYVSAVSPSLDDNKAQKSIDVRDYYTSLITLPNGYTYNSVLYDISVARINELTPEAAYAGFSNIDNTTWPWDSTYYWIAADGSHTTFLASTDFIAFAQAVNGYVVAAKRNLASIIAAIAGAANQTALDAIDITAGYPTPHN